MKLLKAIKKIKTKQQSFIMDSGNGGKKRYSTTSSLSVPSTVDTTSCSRRETEFIAQPSFEQPVVEQRQEEPSISSNSIISQEKDSTLSSVEACENNTIASPPSLSSLISPEDDTLLVALVSHNDLKVGEIYIFSFFSIRIMIL